MSTMDGLPGSKEPKLESPIEQTASIPEVVPATPESLQADLAATNTALETQHGIIASTKNGVNEIRHRLGLEGEETDILSLALNRENAEELEKRRLKLETRLQEVLKSDVSQKYGDIVKEVRDSKIDWAHSEELARRLKLRGVTDDEVLQIRDWLVNNATNAKTFVLSSSKFAELREILREMQGQEKPRTESAFYVPGGSPHAPESIKNSVVMPERPPLPPIPGKERLKETIDLNNLHHELGHATEDGVFDSGLYSDWQAKTKEGAPDPDYIGSIQETDVRVRAMFRDLAGLFDPHKERFDHRHLEILKEKLKRGEVSSDTRELLAHYDDDQIIEHANNLLAI